MITNDNMFISVKHMVLEHVARLAWNDELDEDHLDALVDELIPGPKPQYRCCIYKEREVLKQRLKLARGKNTTANPDSGNVVQVIQAACDQCPISTYTVTDNCRLCLGKACLSSCNFGAVSIGDKRSHIDPNKCRECGKCAAACPYGVIVHLVRPCKKVCPVGAISFDENGFCVIDESKCINCGHCIHSCPCGAISSKTYLVQIIDAIRNGKKVIAMCAPSIEGQFGEKVSLQSIKNALIRLGFADMIEVGLGADITAAYESAEWTQAKKEGRRMTTSCCPAFINMLRNNFPEQYKENMSEVVSPMCAVSRYLKHLDPECVTVFIGPCIAKKSETLDKSVSGNADYAITFGELRVLMRSKNLEFEETDEQYQESSVWGKRFASAGGVANAVIECMKERGEDTTNIRLCKATGALECRKALALLKAGKLPEDFIEGMACPDGCVGGPSNHRAPAEISKAREKLLSTADGRSILKNVEDLPLDKFSMFRDGHIEKLPG